MGEELFDETVLEELGAGMRTLFVRGGYSRDEVWVGIGKLGGTDPDVVVEVDGATLRDALNSMNIGKQMLTRRKRRKRTRAPKRRKRT